MDKANVKSLQMERLAGQTGTEVRGCDKEAFCQYAHAVTPFKVGVLLALLIVLGASTGSYFVVKEWRGYKHDMQLQAEKVNEEITNLRSLLLTNIEEELIRLKILVLRPKAKIQLVNDIAAAVCKYVNIYNKDPDLILAIMRIESAFDPQAISRVGAIGLMQIMPHWIEVLDIQCDLNEPDCNTKYGIQILGAYEQMYGSLDLALTAYNRGPGPVDTALMRGKDPDNGYAGKVKTVYSRLRSINGKDNPIELASIVAWK